MDLDRQFTILTNKDSEVDSHCSIMDMLTGHIKKKDGWCHSWSMKIKPIQCITTKESCEKKLKKSLQRDVKIHEEYPEDKKMISEDQDSKYTFPYGTLRMIVANVCKSHVSILSQLTALLVHFANN